MKSQLVRSDAPDYATSFPGPFPWLEGNTLDFTSQRRWFHYIDRFQLRTYSPKNSSWRFFFRFCCLCVFLFIHAVLRKTSWVHCLSSCTVRSLGFLSGLSLYWNNTFIENSFCVVLSKPQRVKLLSKSKRRRHWNLLPSQRPFQWFLWNSRNNIQALHHTLWRYIFTTDILTQLFFSFIF